MGLMMAEALGYRVDELGPALAMAGKMAGKMVKKKAMGMAADRMKKKEQEKEAGADAGMEVAHTIYKQIGTVMAEAMKQYGTPPDPKKLNADKLVKKQTPEQKAETEKDPRAKSAAERR